MTDPEQPTPAESKSGGDAESELAAGSDVGARRSRRTPVIVGVLVVALVVVALLAVRLITDTSDGSQSGGAVLKTPKGSFTLVGVDYAERLPPGCKKPGTADCVAARSGFKVLRIRLESTSSDKSIPSFKEASVMAKNGNRTNAFGGGFRGGGGDSYLLFTPKASDRNFTLHWFDNPPMKLDK